MNRVSDVGELTVNQIVEPINQSLRESFESRWVDGNPVPIEQCLPQRGQPDYLPTLEELVRIDLEHSRRAARTEVALAGATVANYLRRFPELDQPARVARLERRERDLQSVFSGSASAATLPIGNAARGSSTTAGGTGGTVADGTVADGNRGKVVDSRIGSPHVASPSAGTIGQADDGTVSDDRQRKVSLPELGAFGDYDLLGRLGEGGMGVVYRARQRDANRVVALKVIHGERPGSSREATRQKAIERFRTEAQAAARLEHENIVPVYDVGQAGDHLYFSMRLVEGRSLNEIVREEPLEQRRAARYVLGAARGIAEAHRQGILHRDLKPHNIMIDARADRALVADFGLAKVVESDDQITRTGEAIGTPSYMPPEQIGNAATVTSTGDIYSLGATLYHLLTGRPPFQAPNTLATLRQVLYQEAVSPRLLNSAIDKDLETICLKCLQKEPQRRYADATQLGDDLERYVRGEPIHARPISSAERAVRWCRRNPLPASLGGLAVALALAVFLAVVVGYRATSGALARAETNFQLAKSTVDELYTQTSEIDLRHAPGLQGVKRNLLARSLAYYQKIVAEREQTLGEGTRGGTQGARGRRSRELSAELAANHYRLGAITEEIESPAQAEPHYQRAIAINERLLTADSDDAQLQTSRQVALGDAWNALGRVRQQLDDLAGAEMAFQHAADVREKLAARDADNKAEQSEARRKYANILMNLGLLAERRQQTAEAGARYERAQEIRARLLADQREEGVVRDFAKGAFNLGRLALSQQQHAAAVQNFQSAVSQFETLSREHPENLEYAFQLGVASYMLADAFQLSGETTQAMESYARAQSRLQQLVDDNPLVLEYQRNLITASIGRAQLELNLGKAAGSDPMPLEAEASRRHYERAEQTLLASQSVLERALQRNGEIASLRLELATVRWMLGDIQLVFSDRARAREFFQSALEMLRPLAAQFDAVPEYAHRWQAIQKSLEAL